MSSSFLGVGSLNSFFLSLGWGKTKAAIQALIGDLYGVDWKLRLFKDFFILQYNSVHLEYNLDRIKYHSAIQVPDKHLVKEICNSNINEMLQLNQTTFNGSL